MAFLVLSTFSSQKEAQKCAEKIVSARLAACASVIPQINSTYTWKNKLCVSCESLMIAKTTEKRYPALEREIKRLNSNEVPEIIAVKIARGSKEYLAWVETACKK
ncbi:Divalent-cation tolerance protein CutA [uncultured archaeon]|nr:Divalent-cation tolerance protein CutA [uncultured archaeon]